MAPHSSTLAWKIPWMEEPSGLPSMGLHRVGHDWSDLAAAAAAAAAAYFLAKEMATHSNILAWRISWTEQPGRGQLVHGVTKESDTTEWLTHTHCSKHFNGSTHLIQCNWITSNSHYRDKQQETIISADTVFSQLSKYSTCINLFNSHNNPMMENYFYFHFKDK